MIGKTIHIHTPHRNINCLMYIILHMYLRLQFVPESPRFLLLKGKEEKAKKVLALIARINCKQPLSGRLVTQEEKEKMLEEKRKERSSSANGITETASTETENITSVETEADLKDYGSVQDNKENELTADDDLVMMPSDSDSDLELLIVSDEHTNKRTLSLDKIKKIVKEKSTEYYHWFLLLFKNGWWRTTLILWYLW